MKPADIAAMTRVMGTVVREFTAKAVADAVAPLLARNAALEQRILELETRPEPAAGPMGPIGPSGQKGEPGAGVAALVINADGRLLAQFTDGRSLDVGPMPRAEKGETGARGDVGPMGPIGPQGEPGLAGDNGLDGARGEMGPMGPQGLPGERGERGEKGLDGLTGPIGQAGPQGVPGERGEQGLAGVQGKDGAPGERGLPGEKGLDGLAGRDGRDGVAGAPGTPGEKGLDGRDGANGLNGKDGLDGLGFDDFDLILDETRGWILRLVQGDRVKEWELGLPFDAKVWAAGTVYPKGAGVTWDGHYWIAQKQSSEQPGEGSPAWRLAVRRGKQGREGKQGKDGAAGRDLTQMDPSTGRKW